MMLIMSIININNIEIEKKAENILCLIHNVAHKTFIFINAHCTIQFHMCNKLHQE